MATANFRVINARGYYTILDSYECENMDGVMETHQRDEWDFEDIMDNIRYNTTFQNPRDGWNERMDAKELCSDCSTKSFGNAKPWFIDTYVESVITISSGYYSGAVLDYDICLESMKGDNFFLSEYRDVDEMINDYLDTLEDIVYWEGYSHKWNVGTFKIQKKNIRRWLEKHLENEIQKCEDFCKENCEVQLAALARFSNGETMYTKVG